MNPLLAHDPLRSPVRIDADRLWARLDDLAQIGAVDGVGGARGNCRLALTDADREGRDLVVGWMRDLGLEVIVDVIGNVFATLPGTDPTAPAVMIGSHIDTVRTGGRFDGNLGVLAGLEIIEALIDSGYRTEHPITVAFFTDEEGSRFAPDMLGSLVYVGGMAVERALDICAVDDGARLGDELARIGYAGSAPCPAPAPPKCFLELHIEQGPILEDAGITIGVVEGVQGISWTEFTLTGRSAHAGTTPIAARRDPLLVAAQVVAEVRMLCRDLGGSQVATVGRFEPHPNLVNVVASQVIFTVDLRNTDDLVLIEAERRLLEFVEQVAQAESVSVQTRVLSRFAPVDFDHGLAELIERCARSEGASSLRLPSGAGHDAQMLARICPSAMVFVPSVGGLSHNLAEYTDPGDVAVGAQVLADAVLASAVLLSGERVNRSTDSR
jgi:N-carbamoyl-L-amino-acid hydrolase